MYRHDHDNQDDQQAFMPRNKHVQHKKHRLPGFDQFVQGLGHSGTTTQRHEVLDRSRQVLSSQPVQPSGATAQDILQDWPRDFQQPATSLDRSWYAYGPSNGSQQTTSLRLNFERRLSQTAQTYSPPAMRYVRSRSSEAIPLSRNQNRELDQQFITVEVSSPEARALEGPARVDEHAGNPNPTHFTKYGLTKTGRIRKRLDKACNACRTKKIKCDPGGPKSPRCGQCRKKNESCDYSVRHGVKTNSTASPEAITSTPDSPSEDCSSKLAIEKRSTTLTRSECQSRDIIDKVGLRTPNTSRTNASLSMSNKIVKDPTSSKRQRVDSDATDSQHSEGHRTSISAPGNTQMVGDELGFRIDIDPMAADAELAKHYLEMFLTGVNNDSFSLFPRASFRAWALTSRSKTLQDRLLFYAVLAIGTAHSTNSQRQHHRQMFKDILSKAPDHIYNTPQIQIVQMELFWAFAEFVDLRHEAAHMTFSKAVAHMSWAKYNLENQALSADDTNAYGFEPNVLAECRRRTFWACVLYDASTGALKGNAPCFRKEDIFLRLPCRGDLYEAGNIPKTAHFDPNNTIPQDLTRRQYSELSDMAFTIQVTLIAHEIQLHYIRSQEAEKVGRLQQNNGHTRLDFERRLRDWQGGYNIFLESRLEDDLTYNIARKPHSVPQTGMRAPRFAGMDVVCHLAYLKLSRQILHSKLTHEEITDHARSACMHSLRILELAKQMKDRDGHSSKDYMTISKNPLAGAAIAFAVDTLTAAGRISDYLEYNSRTMSLLYAGLELLGDIAQYWSAGERLQRAVQQRVQIHSQLNCASVNGNLQTYFYCTKSLCPGQDSGFDLTYGTDRKQYIKAVCGVEEEIQDSEILELDGILRNDLHRTSIASSGSGSNTLRQE